MNVEKEKKDKRTSREKKDKKEMCMQKKRKGETCTWKKGKKTMHGCGKEKKGAQNNLETGCCATNTGQITQEKTY